jgi:hypothetical protein
MPRRSTYDAPHRKMPFENVSSFLLITGPQSFCCWGLACCLAIVANAQAQEVPVSFSTEIQPILARRCFPCHGPDKAEAGLRLNSLETAVAQLESGNRAIVPGDTAASAILERITSSEDGVRMPPEGKPLTEIEQQRFARWVAQGAEWKQHWAFDPIRRTAIPLRPDGTTAENAIDAFIESRLSAKNLSMSPRAEPRALLRRLSYDLIGLPPAPEQVTDFEQRASIDFNAAWEAEIDRLLASEHYGERWARHWLDVVRYAETNSFERDGPKPHAWRYRDYVIRAFNADKPYNQFLLEQLAGDELPEITKDSLIATGFYRLGIWDDEPADRELAMYDGFDDIVTTVGQGLLGLTLNCSRCHDHKIDPLPTKDYYATVAFFRNLTPNGYGPQVERPLLDNIQDRQSYAAREASLRESGNQLQMRINEVEELLRNDLESSELKADRVDLDEMEYRFYRDTFRQLPDFDAIKPETVGKLDPPLLDIGLATRPDDFGFVFVGKLIVPEEGEYSFRIDSDDGSRLTIDGNIVIEYDGIHGTGQPKRGTTTLSAGRHDFRVDYFQGSFGKGLLLDWSGPSFKRRPLTRQNRNTVDLNQILQSSAAENLNPDHVSEYKKLRRELEQNSKRKPWDEYGMCASESGTNPPDTHILMRGSPQAPGDLVQPAFPAILGGGVPEIAPNTDAKTSGRRLAFARWVASPENRLTSRVLVNRIWQHHFGRGIVRSPNNFGQLGEPPTHPELLDYLATQFVHDDWSIKSLHKKIVKSRAYQQSSIASPDVIELDPINDGFSRFDLRRLSAEEIRDSILIANGRLNRTLYGPSIYPELSAEVLASQSVPGKGWEKSTAADQSRRSVYIHVKRSLLVPMLSNFDFPEPDTSCEARFITTQPGQALGMMNGDFLNQQASEFAHRLATEAGDNRRDQVARGYALALARPPTEREIERGLTLIDTLEFQHGLSRDVALANFALFLFNINEFVYLD